MKLAKTILAGAIAVAGISTARADVTVYITGATAYRSPAVAAIKSYLSGGFVGIYGAKSGVTSELNAANCAFRGTVSGDPSNVITIKCAWGGSVGGIKLIQSTTTFNVNDQPGVKGWIPDGALPAGNTGGSIFAGTEGTTTIVGADTTNYTFESGASAAKPDAAFTDAFQSSALGGAAGDAVGLGTDTATGKIGVIPFNYVVSNGVSAASVTVFTGVSYAAGVSTINYTATSGAAPAIGKTIGGAGIPVGTTITGFTATTIDISPAVTTAAQQGAAGTAIVSAADTASAPFNNITSIQANQIAVGGGRLPMFTGNSADSTVGVFCFGRNADSGTRISNLGEINRGITARPGFHLQPAFDGAAFSNGAGGLPSKRVSNLRSWPLESVLGVTYTPGQGGYNSGGDLADALTAYGSATTGVTAPVPRAGWIVGYLGRSDASRACAKTFGQNTAKRLTFNGEQDWNGLGSANNIDGTPVGGFNDAAVREGRYQAWEFEHFYKKLGTPAPESAVLDGIAASILAAPAPSGTISLSTMHVTRSVEGGAISYP